LNVAVRRTYLLAICGVKFLLELISGILELPETVYSNVVDASESRWTTGNVFQDEPTGRLAALADSTRTRTSSCDFCWISQAEFHRLCRHGL